jgi:riboflavin biosynthesis pyrimidine reductase
VRRLLPVPVEDDVDLEAAYAAPSRWVRGLMVSSVDGAIEVGGSSGPLSGPADRRVLLHLRAAADGVLVGAQSVRAEGWLPPRPSAAARARRRAAGRPEVPAYAVVSRSGDLPRRDAEGEVLVVSGTPQEVLDGLAARGLTRVLCEGGPSWLAQVAATGRLDELCLTTSPQLAGPGRGRLLQGGEWDVPVPLRLTSLLEDDGWLFARYATTAAGQPPSTSPPAS